jgi:hypothetical protein
MVTSGQLHRRALSLDQIEFIGVAPRVMMKLPEITGGDMLHALRASLWQTQARDSVHSSQAWKPAKLAALPSDMQLAGLPPTCPPASPRAIGEICKIKRPSPQYPPKSRHLRNALQRAR